MVSVSEAKSIIESHLYIPNTEIIDITNSIGRVLAEPMIADRDFPPFDRVAMDGIAISHQQFIDGKIEFEVESIAAAGCPQLTLHDQSKCVEVMTGAPLPVNTDTVIRYEDLTVNESQVKINLDVLDKKQNIHPQAQDAQEGEELLPIGTVISPAEVALMASIGKSKISVKTYPRTAIISTGDELVDIDDIPKAHQIRRSNSYALEAALNSLGCKATKYHMIDKRDAIERNLGSILGDHELVILSGGVSKGKFDYVPEVLEQLGVAKHFHRVKQKPGKPFWFGSLGNKVVFALPGNPVSTFLCFYKYIKPWFQKSWGIEIEYAEAHLGTDFEFNGNLTYFLQVKVSNKSGKLIAHPIPGGGSGDFANLKDANAFMELPEEEQKFKQGEVFPIYCFRSQ